MQRLYRIDTYYLTEGEVEYENNIRPSSSNEDNTGDQTPGHGITSPAGRLAQKMAREYRERIEPSTIGRIQDDAIEQTATELDLCERMITELDELVQQAVMLQYQGGRPTGAIGLASRMAHYAKYDCHGQH